MKQKIYWLADRIGRNRKSHSIKKSITWEGLLIESLKPKNIWAIYQAQQTEPIHVISFGSDRSAG